MPIRAELPKDAAAIRAVNLAAFETPAEADLVEALRKRASPTISLVAEEEGAMIGHIYFAAVELPESLELPLMGLAPMAVVPDFQGKGIGTSLVRAGLGRCKREGVSAVVVLGHPNYYKRFGFGPASKLGLTSEFKVPNEVFMVLELVEGSLKGKSGVVQYHSAFKEM